MRTVPGPDDPAADPSPRTNATGYLDAAGTAAALARGDTTSVDVVVQLLRRIDELDRSGPALRSVLATCPDALDTAARLDAERRAGTGRPGPLHGLAVLVKDNIDTAGEPATTAGSLALASTRPAADATVVRRLREAGAVVLAKANLSEWANIRSGYSSSGWSAVGGQCRNPHALDRSPGGSSSGSAAAVAAGLAPLAVGTETDGSILCPATLNGVVGIKPTVGLVSRQGVVPISHSQDTVGPFARTVADAALLLGVLAGPGPGRDPADRATRSRPAGLDTDYLAACDPGGLVGARLGVVRGSFGRSVAGDVLVEAALDVARDAGAVLVDPVEVPGAAALAQSDDEMTVLLCELKAGLEAYLGQRPADDGSQPRTMAELIAFNEAHAELEMPRFGQDHFIAAAATDGLDEPGYRRARAAGLRRARSRGIDAALAAGAVDVLVAPTMAPAWLIDDVNGDPPIPGCYRASAVAGYPAITLPVGSVRGLPAGLCLMGPAWSEALLVRLAYAFEQALAIGDTLRPAFAPSAS
jgi:amidase